MKEFNSLKSLWQQQGEQQKMPDVSEMVSVIEKNRRRTIWRHAFVLFQLALAMGVIIFVGLHYEFRFVTTYAGIILTVLSIVFGMGLNARSLSILNKKIDLTLDSKSYLNQMIKYKREQQFMHTRAIKLYLIVLSIGLTFYIAEFAVRDLKFGIIVYLLTFSWIAFSWFVVGKRSIKKEQKKVREQIERIKNLKGDLES